MSQPTLTRWWRGAAVLIAVLAVIAATLLAGRPDARAVSADIVISQIYGGGGNSGATLRNDFIELFNRGASPVSVTGWSVQWASATTNVWQVTSLTDTIQPGAHYLVQQAAGAGGSVNLPTPDATGTIMMGATSGKAALVTNTTALTCGAGPTCLPNAAIRDFVGYGATADNFEGAAPTGAAPSNTTAVLRAAAGCTDTDQNSADFTAAVPNPRNSASTVAPCAPGTPGPSPSGSPGGSPGSTPTPTPTAGAAMRIRDIQGVAHTSPRLGQIVAGVPGIVTVRRANGFYVQDPSPDANPGTSEGIFVFTSSAPSVNAGDSVLVSGTVSEFRGGCNPSCDPAAGAFDNLTITQIGAPSLHVSVRSSGNPLPPATVIGSGGRVPPSTVIDDDATGNVETSGSFDIADGIDFYESLEGMRVQVNNAVAVGPRTDFSNDASEIPVLADNGAGASVRTARGGIIIRPTDFNPERIILATATSATPPINVSDRFPGATVGVIDYTFGNFKLLVTTLPAFTSGGITPESATPALPNQLSIATFNVENLDPNDSGLKFTQLASVIVNNLKAPDIIAVEEIQDNNGPVNDAIVDATVTFNTLISAITGAGGPAYQFRQINPVDDQDGGEPGGNIRVGFLFRTDRGLTFVDRPKGDSTGGGPAIATAVVNTPDGPQLSASPGRIDPANLAFTTSRKPLAGEFQFGVKGPKVFVIANHFNSKGGDDPLFGRFQPPVRITETQRHQQAQVLNSFVASLLAADPNANVVVAGDFNDFDFSQTLSILRGTQLFNLFDTLPAAERYSYVFEGNSQTLDHILVSRNLLQNTQIQYDVVHVNSEFANQISDHEPQVARITFTAPPPTPAPNVSPAPKPVPGAGPTPAPSPTPSSTPSPTAIPSPTPTAAPTTTPKPGPMLPTATPTPTPGPTMTPKAVPGLARHNAPAPWIAAAHPIGRIMRQESQRSLIAASPLTPLNLALKLA